MATLLATDRLILRYWEDRDLIPFTAMNQDAEVMRYFPSTLTAEQTQALLQRILDQHATHGYGLWVVDRKEDGAFLGFTGLSNPSFEADFTPCTEVGWRFRKEYWGRGYAIEAAKACLEYGFQNLALEKIYSFTAVHNLPSEAVMKRIGMQKIGEFDHPQLEPGHVLQRHVLYMATVSSKVPG